MQVAVRTKPSGHVVSAAMAALVCVAVQRHFAAVVENDLSDIRPDAFVLTAATPFGVFLILFLGAHLLLSSREIGNRAIYSALGSVAALVAFGASAFSTTIPAAVESGSLSVLLAIVGVAGALIGFLHVRSAGYSIEGDQPDKLATYLGLAAPPVTADAAHVGSAESERLAQVAAPAHLATDSADYFDGPLQVITSGKAVFLAALVGGMVYAFWMTVQGLVFVSSSAFSGFSPNWADAMGGAIEQLGLGLIFGCAMGAVFMSPFIYGCHLFARARKKTTLVDYVKLGAIAPIAIGLAIFIVGIFVTYNFILPMAVAMGAYHKLAGLEPESLPDDIEVRDRRTLVGADHARRRYRRVVG